MLMKKKIFFGFVLFFLIAFFYKPSLSFAQSCGGAYQVCCSSPGSTACNNSGGTNLSCIGGHCVPGSACGNAGEACCAGNTCNYGIQCINGSCGAVGATAAPYVYGGGAELCGTGINTAIGCIPVLADDNGVSFMGWILKWAVGIGGGIAFILIMYGGFMVMTSQGNPERVKAGQELITSAVSGLILLVLSIFLLKFIGVDILGLGAWGFGQ
jgi:hypothetical protein